MGDLAAAAVSGVAQSIVPFQGSAGSRAPLIGSFDIIGLCKVFRHMCFKTQREKRLQMEPNSSHLDRKDHNKMDDVKVLLI